MHFAPFIKNKESDKIIFSVGQKVCVTTEAFLDVFHLSWPLGAGDPPEYVRTMTIQEVQKTSGFADDYNNYCFFGDKYSKRSWRFYEIESYEPVTAQETAN